MSDKDKLEKVVNSMFGSWENKSWDEWQSDEDLDEIVWVKKEEETDLIETDLTDWVKTRIDNIIEPGDLEKLRYFIMKLVEKNTWERASIKTDADQNNITIDIKWNIDWNLEKIILKIVSAENKYFIKKNNIFSSNIKIDWGNYFIGFDEYSNFIIYIDLKNKLKDNDLKDIKDLLENNIFNNLEISKNNITLPEITQVLSLTTKDKCVIDWNKINLSIYTPEKIQLANKELEKIISWLNSLNKKLFLKLNKKHCFEESIQIEIIEISYWIDTKNRHNLKLSIEENEIILTLDSHSRVEVSFLENIIKNFINSVKSLGEKTETSLEKLKEMWVMVIENSSEEEKDLSLEEIYDNRWFVWYEDIKEILETNVVYPWLNKEKYIELQEQIFENIKNIIPNAVLFEWPPWTGKTTTAEIIGEYLKFPFVYIPINALMSKWYWESEKKLSAILELVWKIWEENSWVVVLIDEIDEIWWNRDKTHEATGRMTGVLLKKLDWLEKLDNLLLFASTNRKNHLDSALLSRFTKEIFFRLPKQLEIKSILNHYLWIEIENEELLKRLMWKSWRDLKQLSEDYARYYIKQSLGNQDLDKQKEFEKFVGTKIVKFKKYKELKWKI